MINNKLIFIIIFWLLANTSSLFAHRNKLLVLFAMENFRGSFYYFLTAKKEILSRTSKVEYTPEFKFALESFFKIDSFKIYPSIYLKNEKKIKKIKPVHHYIRSLVEYLQFYGKYNNKSLENLPPPKQILFFKKILYQSSKPPKNTALIASYHSFRGLMFTEIGHLLRLFLRMRTLAVKKYEKARKEFELAITQNPKSLNAHIMGISNIAENLGNYKLALEKTRIALIFFPNSSELHGIKARIYAKLGNNLQSIISTRLCNLYLKMERQALPTFIWVSSFWVPIWQNSSLIPKFGSPH